MTLTSSTVLLFTDIADSTRAWEEEPTAMSRALAAHDVLFADVVSAAGGRIVKHTGDGFMASFPDGGSAARAAVVAQRRLAESVPVLATGAIRVRMGIHGGPVEERADDVLGPTVNRAARLMGAAHGSQILVSEAVAAEVRAEGFDLIDLGEHRFKGLTEPMRVHHLAAPGVALLRDLPPLQSLGAARIRLPMSKEPLIGRVEELQVVRSRLSPGRLTTITGPGGQGKTRLAVEVARREAPGHADGAALVELERGISTSVLSLTAAAIGLERLVERADEIAEHLTGRRMLLVLDNCEHVTREVVDLVRSLLERAESVTVLATSIRPLGLAGEQVIPLPPLAAGDGSAVELFTSIAGAAGSVTLADPAVRETVEKICARLDGNPLAIKLAAARAALLGSQEVLDHLDERLRLLVDPRSDERERHASLRATMDWSYRLLTTSQQDLFARVSVFTGSFDLRSAQQVAETDPVQVAGDLSELVASSLVASDDDGTAARYRLTETARLFGLDRLATEGREPSARLTHACHMLALVGDAHEGLRGSDAARWRTLVSGYLEDIESAARALVSLGHLGEALSIVGALMPFEAIRWYTVAGWAERLLEQEGAAGHPHAVEVLIQAGVASMLRGDGSEAVRRCRQALDLAASCGREVGGHAWSVMANVAVSAGDFAGAIERITQGVAAARRNGDPFDLANSLAGEAIMRYWSGSEGAVRSARESVDIAELLGNETILATAYGALGTAHLQVDPDQARELLEVSLSWAHLAGDQTQLSTGLRSISALEGSQGRWVRAAEVGLQALAHDDRVGDRTEFALVGHHLARVFQKLDRDDLTVALEHLLTRYPYVLSAGFAARAVERARERLGPAAAARAAQAASGLAAIDLIAWMTGELEVDLAAA
jgi:predicted ATPase/class 3 adenylate cyclase